MIENALSMKECALHENNFFGKNNPEKFFYGKKDVMDKNSKVDKKEISKAYGKYIEQFTPKPKYFRNSVMAFVTGGTVCVISMWLENRFIASGVAEKDAATYVVVILVMTAQLLTGFGIFDTIAKYAGAGVIVPITGFANSMVAPALEYKKEGVVLGVGGKMFSLAGPVLVCGITISSVVGIVYWLLGVLM